MVSFIIISHCARTGYVASEDCLDDELAVRVLRLLRLLDSRRLRVLTNGCGCANDLNSTAGVRLELAMLRFFGQFHQMYLGENSCRPSKLKLSFAIAYILMSVALVGANSSKLRFMEDYIMACIHQI
ncbi:unnamed protein product [Protopolystoma xenopodis]|uniref:Exportin-7/Ran-binding protein 17 TPR repeats domain-containing protein n=1 Tax=Protopolystoma xenopodis TaxID=117903 RepID=A0A3S5BNQ2_9PLAT|nr:unnamed protein product [Protopolystoma xenopodis]